MQPHTCLLLYQRVEYLEERQTATELPDGRDPMDEEHQQKHRVAEHQEKVVYPHATRGRNYSSYSTVVFPRLTLCGLWCW